jgi:hypothetical protein
MGQICKEEIKRVNQCLSSSRNMHTAIENSKMQVPKNFVLLWSNCASMHSDADLHKKLQQQVTLHRKRAFILMLDWVYVRQGINPSPFHNFFGRDSLAGIRLQDCF